MQNNVTLFGTHQTFNCCGFFRCISFCLLFSLKIQFMIEIIGFLLVGSSHHDCTHSFYFDILHNWIYRSSQIFCHV